MLLLSFMIGFMCVPNKQPHHNLYLSIWSQSLHCLWLFGRDNCHRKQDLVGKKKIRRLCWQGYCYRAWVLYLDSPNKFSKMDDLLRNYWAFMRKQEYHSNTLATLTHVCWIIHSLILRISFRQMIYSSNDSIRFFIFLQQKNISKKYLFCWKFQHFWK